MVSGALTFTGPEVGTPGDTPLARRRSDGLGRAHVHGDGPAGPWWYNRAMARHRGKHPADAELFADAALPVLGEAVDDLSWLLGRGYAEPSALKLVGDRFGLRQRQRRAVLMCACSDEARAGRIERRLAPADLAGRAVAIDGFNAIITCEAALAGGLVLRGRDRAHRDLSSVHGTYRKVAETAEAVRRLAAVLSAAAPASITCYLDRPVSNSGRLAALIADLAPTWQTELVYDPDGAIVASGAIAASSDAFILDRATASVDLPAAVLADLPAAWVVAP
jgi:hypothetical protein